MKSRYNLFFVAALAGIALVGCNDTADPVGAGGIATVKASDFKPDSRAGVEIAPGSVDPAAMKTLVASRSFAARPDPFSLLAMERIYERSQQTERLVGEAGFSVMVDPPVERDPALDQQEEAQPYRRLAGVIVGDTVMAILMMEDGRAEIIRPGMMIPNTEWRVVSINEEYAVLRRAGNRRPNTITVPLEQDRGGFGGGAPQGGGGGGQRGGGGGNSGRGGRGPIGGDDDR